MNQIINHLALEIEIVEPAILITVDHRFRPGISDNELYQITRRNWIIGERRNKAKYAFCVYDGIVQQVYEIQGWLPGEAQNRWRFDGRVAQELQHYVGGKVEKYVGGPNTVWYVNC